MSVAARTGDGVQARRATLVRAGAGAAPLLVALVGGSFLLRVVVGWLRPAPTFFADEYIYAELGRSLAEGGGPLIRGASASFPALLQPILTAPAWLLADVETSFRAVQTIGALLMSLAAVPVFLLARRLDLDGGVALALAALAVALPDLIYTGWIVAEPVAYPLALAAVLAGTAALARPSARLHLAFLALAGLVTLARLQFVILPLCFVGAALIMGLRERRLRAGLRAHAFLLGLLALPLAGLALVGPGRALGFYESATDTGRYPPELAAWVGKDALVLVVVSGIVLVPGALLGLWLALRRPRSREELAFGALAVPLVLGLLVEAGAWGGEVGRVQERYVFYAVPLVGIAFGLYASRGWPHRLVHAGLAAGLVALLARVPFAGFAAQDGKTNSPTLQATARLEAAVGSVGLASLVIALGAAALLLVVAAAAWRGAPTRLALGLAVGVCATGYAGVALYGIENAGEARRNILGPVPSFVDASGVAGAALLQSPSSDPTRGSALLFWNRSVDTLYLLPGAQPPDTFVQSWLEIAPDGALLAGGEPVTRPLVVDGFSDTLRFRDSSELAASPIYKLLRSNGPHRLALYAPGRGEDGWLGANGSVQLWPESAAVGLAGTLSFRLTAPADVERTTIVFEREGAAVQELVLEPGSAREVAFAVCSPGAWHVNFSAPTTGSVGSRLVSVRTTEPVFRPDPTACPG